MAYRIRVERLLTISHLRKGFVNLHAGVDEDLTLSLETSHQIQSKRGDTNGITVIMEKKRGNYVTEMSPSAALYKPKALLMSHRFPTFFSSLSTPHPSVLSV
ncbi:hypothetical protein L1887_20493 [Cichorium endivia]|nr:hypothetical protein L1887_20493 [Cichorium endivia]